MYAMTGTLIAHAGKRTALIKILINASEIVKELPGCRMYIVGEDSADANAIHVMEIWDNQTSHDDSLKDTRVRALIAEAMPMMGGSPSGSSMKIIGGYGIKEK